MKIKMEIDENLQEEEIIVRCRELSDDVVAMQRRIAEAVHAGMRLTVTRGDLEYFLPLNEILFFETADSVVAVHTATQIYETHLRLCGYMSWKKCFRAVSCGYPNPAL